MHANRDSIMKSAGAMRRYRRLAAGRDRPARNLLSRLGDLSVYASCFVHEMASCWLHKRNVQFPERSMETMGQESMVTVSQKWDRRVGQWHDHVTSAAAFGKVLDRILVVSQPHYANE
jgi:hypothetical protein